MSGVQVLVVDDEDRLRQLLRLYLEREGMAVLEACSGQEALETFAAHPVDLVVLDIMLPRGDGWFVCRQLRKTGQVPVILLTARSAEEDRLLGFDLGADDYVVKPFSPRELVARVKALLRRAGVEGSRALLVGRLLVDVGARRAEVDGREVSLTPKEFDLLALLAGQPGQAFSRERILARVWGYDFYGDTRTVDTHVKNLREKLKNTSAAGYLQTVWGVGYKLEISPPV